MLPAPDQDTRPDDLHLAFLATPVAVRDSLARMMALPPLCRLSAGSRGTAELVLAEVLNNVAEHAYAEQSGPVSVTIRSTGKGLRCRVMDRGRAMPDGTLPPGRLLENLDLPLDDMPEGGFGWHLIRSLTTELSYTRIGDQNLLQFTLP